MKAIYVVLEDFGDRFIVDPYDDYCDALRRFLEIALDVVDATESEGKFESLGFTKFIRDEVDGSVLKKAIEDKLNMKVEEVKEIATFFAETSDNIEYTFLLEVLVE